jgi:hypothetical protein
MAKSLAVYALLILSVALFTSSGESSSAKKPDEEMVTLFGGSGNDLLERCSAPTYKVGDTVPAGELIRTARDNGLCVGYIMGVSDAGLNYIVLAPNVKRRYCLPSEARSGQLVMVVKKYLEDNPAQLHLPAGVLTTDALIAAFPCH